MRPHDSNRTSQSANDGSAELTLKGQSVSKGIAIGHILCLYGMNRQFYRFEIAKSDIPAEIERFRASIRSAARRLEQISGLEQWNNASAAAILDAQRLMLDDPVFLSEIEAIITKKRVNSEWAVKEVAASYAAQFKALPDERLRERYIDVEDVSERIIASLSGKPHGDKGPDKNTIIAASELRPSTLVEFTSRRPKAFITEHGGWTSHTFILARELNIPAVAGIRRLLRKIKTGEQAVVDGYQGLVIVRPSRETLERYKAEIGPQVTKIPGADLDRDLPRTLDGHPITIRANLDIPAVYRRAARFGAKGIGLYRSEFLFNQFRGFPSEAEQCRAYAAIADFAGADGVKIRTFDLAASQLLTRSAGREKNPALGLRAIRLSLEHERQFRIQLRALLRASAGRHIDIVIPMVSGVSELRKVRSMLTEEEARLARKGTETGKPGIGAMIEVPSAVLTIDAILEEADFISLGTNDLVQYLLAADRDNESVAEWFRTLHPAVTHALKIVIDACRKAEKPLIVCGEMAGSPFYVPLLIGMGMTELSMNINSILKVRKVISGISFDDAAAMAERIERSKTADEAEQILYEQIEKKWKHLYPPVPGTSISK